MLSPSSRETTQGHASASPSNMNHPIQYVVITPVRDEEKHVECVLKAMISQTLLPAKWVIVDDGSSDNTVDILERYTESVRWIQVVRRPNRGARKSGAGVIEAFYDGYKEIAGNNWDFIVKLDGDLTFPSDYFEKCFEHFKSDPKLGIGGGDIYHEFNGQEKLEANPKFHVRGATKIYRRACWEAIGGLVQAPGWDTIDEVKANMLGWSSTSFSEFHVIHHRVTGTADGALRDRVKHGLACYVSGYHPLFLAASCVSRLLKEPYIAGSAAIGYGFLKGYWTRMPRVEDQRFIKYLRAQQLRRLCGLETIWR